MKLLTIAQVAREVQLDPITVRRLCAAGKFPGAKKIGGRWRIVAKSFEAWLQEPQPTRVEPKPRKRKLRAIQGGRW